jgi:hypothetical protein
VALDIYVGGLAKYYAGDWQSMGEKSANQLGVPYYLIRADGSTAEKTIGNKQQYKHKVLEWRLALSQKLKLGQEVALDWDEDCEDYFTERPNFEGWGSLVLWAAYSEIDAALPATPNEWPGDSQVTAVRSKVFGSQYPQLIKSLELWLPWDFDQAFGTISITDDVIGIGSSHALLRQLESLNENTWKAAEAEIDSWRDATTIDPFLPAIDKLARMTFPLVLSLTRQSVQRNLPMKLDY